MIWKGYRMGDIKMGIIIGLIVFTGVILAVNYEDILYYVNYQKYHSPTLESGICDTELLDEIEGFDI